MSDDATQVNKYDALRREFGEWLIDPEARGTQQEWALAHGLAEETVSRWKKDPEVRAILARWKSAGDLILPAVVARMRREALGGNVNAARLLGDWFGWAAPTKSAVEHSGGQTVKLEYARGQLRDAAEGLERDGAD